MNDFLAMGGYGAYVWPCFALAAAVLAWNALAARRLHERAREQACRFGAEIRTETPVARILTRAGRATGVVLENGDEIAADVVVSSVDPRLTFERFLEQHGLMSR